MRLLELIKHLHWQNRFVKCPLFDTAYLITSSEPPLSRKHKKHIVYKTIYPECSRGAIYDELNKNKNFGVQPFHRVTVNP